MSNPHYYILLTKTSQIHTCFLNRTPPPPSKLLIQYPKAQNLTESATVQAMFDLCVACIAGVCSHGYLHYKKIQCHIYLCMMLVKKCSNEHLIHAVYMSRCLVNEHLYTCGLHVCPALTTYSLVTCMNSIQCVQRVIPAC